jgi:uncharacterized membrane protein YuzA (DUF378 family)
MKLDLFDWLALILVILGAVNWGFIGLLGFDLVASLLGGHASFASRAVYSLVGFAGAYMIYLLYKLKRG